jgi:hypothetical protein
MKDNKKKKFEIIKGNKLRCTMCYGIYLFKQSFSRHISCGVCEKRQRTCPLLMREHHKKAKREIVKCDCGTCIGKKGVSKHLITKKHQKWVESLVQANKLEKRYDNWKLRSQKLIRDVTLDGRFKVSEELLKRLVLPDSDDELAELVKKKRKEGLI